MELLQLRYFVVTAKEQNMTRAAELLHIAQPALSQSVKRLEEEMGVRLFDRVGKRIRLNDAGRELLRTAEPMLARLSAMPETLQAIAAARFPSSAAEASRIRLAEESAISEAEKNAEPHSSTSMIRT